MLLQAKLHQQVFMLCMEDDKDARWFVVGDVMGSERGKWIKMIFF